MRGCATYLAWRKRRPGGAGRFMQRNRRRDTVLAVREPFVALPPVRVDHQRRHRQRRECGEIGFATVDRVRREYRGTRVRRRERLDHRQHLFLFGACALRLAPAPCAMRLRLRRAPCACAVTMSWCFASDAATPVSPSMTPLSVAIFVHSWSARWLSASDASSHRSAASRGRSRTTRARSSPGHRARRSGHAWRRWR